MAQTGEVGGGAYIVQRSCNSYFNSVGAAGGRGNIRMIDSHHKAWKRNIILLKVLAATKLPPYVNSLRSCT